MDIKYIDLFSLVETTLDEQRKQKLGGLNDYNMVNVVRKETHEVGMHSNIIISLINPNGLHYQDDLFLNLFIDKVIKPELRCQDFGNIFSVQAEELTDNNRRIDFTIKSDKYLIGIEMKVNASDLDNQIKDYYEQLLDEANGDKDKVYIFYLTKYGINPSLQSSRSVPTNKIKNVSFEKHILDWIEVCQEEVKNITNLTVALEDYKNIVKKITNQYEGNVMGIKDDLLDENNQDKLATALELDQEMPMIKGKILFNFFEDIANGLITAKIENENGGDIHISEVRDIITKDRVVDENKCIQAFYNSTPAGNKKYVYCFGKFFDCGFQSNRYLHIEVVSMNIYYGIVELSKNSGKYDLVKIAENPLLDKLLKYTNWNELTWYVKDDKKINGINIIDLSRKKTLELLLDFDKSELKNSLLTFITQYKEQIN